MDKHLLADNPMRPSEGGLCIIKTVVPIGIFEVHEGHVFFDSGKYKMGYRHYTFFEEKYTLSLHYYGGWKQDPPDETEAERQAMNDMDNAWHWFMAYMKWEDEQI
jgi:hypothetical protein